MMLPKQTRLRDRRWLDAQRDEACWACMAQDGTIVPAHIRTGHEAGFGQKPDDDLIVPLCFRCHSDQEANPGPSWWIEHVLKPLVRHRYRKWKRGLVGVT